MAARKPLVINAGQIEQLQSADTLDAAVPGAELTVVENGETMAIAIGQPVYVSGANVVDLAQADAVATSDAIGLMQTVSTSASADGNVQTGGVLEATTGQWDAVTGDTGGLTPGSTYYLDPDTAGSLTTTAPTSVGDVVKPMGEAISTTKMRVLDRPRILL